MMGKARIFIRSLVITAVSALLVLSLWQSATARNEGDAPGRSRLEQLTINAYKKTSEAVVFISTITLSVDPFDFFSSIRPREGSGSGVIVDAKRGIILTNLHVIQDAHKIEILLADGKSYKARLLGHDREYDIAALQLTSPPKNLIAVEFADSSEVEIGQFVIAIGNPHGLNRTLTSGIVSSLGRTVRNPNGFLMKDLIQTDAAINPGNSGGPLLSLNGQMIGMNTAILSRSGDSAGIGFAVPTNQIGRILPELIATGRVLRPKMGWLLMDTNKGPMVRRVIAGGPAEAAGVQAIERPAKGVFVEGYVRDFARADIVTSINGERVVSREQVDQLVSKAKRGESIEVGLRSAGMSGKERTVKVKPVLN